MEADQPVHAAAPHFAVSDNCLLVGGIPLTRLALRVGSTPFYACDRTLLTKKLHHLRGVLPECVKIHYSLKANPMPALVQHMSALVDGFDIASAGEMQLALNAGMAPEHIIFSGPGKTDAELLQALAADVTINIESTNELRRLAQMAKQCKLPNSAPRIMLRINPDFRLRSSGCVMGGGAKPFGIDVEQIPAVLAELKHLPFEFAGFHIFCGSQNLNAAAIVESLTQSCELVLELAKFCSAPVRRINLGGGFGIPYFPGERPLDIVAVTAHLNKCVERLGARWPQLRVEIESGRYLVGEAGVYVTRVIDKKYSRGTCFLVTDGGMHHHLAVSGNFGQVIRKNFPVAVGNKMVSSGHALATVVGPLCSPLDIIAEQMPLAHAEVGDLIVVFQSGAYGRSASPTAFLSHPMPPEILV